MIIVVVAVAATGLILLLLGQNPFRLLRRLVGLSKRERQQLEAERALSDFVTELDGVRHKFSALSAYSNQYFNTFQAAGWDDVSLLIDDVGLAEHSLRLLLERQRYEDVRDVSQFLLGRLPGSQAQQLVGRYEGLENLDGWRRRCLDALLQVTEASIESARKTASVGVSRKRSAKPTLVSLAELRSALIEGK